MVQKSIEKFSETKTEKLQLEFEKLIKQQKIIIHPKINYKKSAIINLTNRLLTDDEASILEKGYNYSIAPSKIPQQDIISSI